MRRDALRTALAGDLSLLKELRPDRRRRRRRGVGFSPGRNQLAVGRGRKPRIGQHRKRLERMRNGQYGVCEGCSCSIPMARLNALPYATLCIECQRESERSGRGSSADSDWGRVLDQQRRCRRLDQRHRNRRLSRPKSGRRPRVYWPPYRQRHDALARSTIQLHRPLSHRSQRWSNWPVHRRFTGARLCGA